MKTLQEEISNYLQSTNLLIFIDDIEIENINDYFIHINIPDDNNYVIYKGIKLIYKSLVYNKEKRILYLNLEDDLKIELERKEFLKIEKINSIIHVSKQEFTSELLNCDEIEYPIFETSIKHLYDGTISVNIYMKYYLEQIDHICVFKETYSDFNLALNETMYIKSLLDKNKKTILRLQNLYDEQTETSILIDGGLYKFNYILNGDIVLNELSEYYNPKNKYIKLYKLLDKSYTIISNGEYIVYDELIFKNNEICEKHNIPKKFKGSYFESMYKFYDTVTQNVYLEDETLDCIKNDIKNNYKKLYEKERNKEFYDIIDNGLVFIQKNKAIKFDKQVIEYIDSVMEKI